MNKQTFTAVVALLFVVSGITGLIYQIVWFKYLSLFLGNTTYAQTIVLATFMGGLALGAWLWGRRADSSKTPLAVYAWLEVGIGMYCVLYPFFIEFLRNAFVGIVHASSLPSDSVTVLAMKLVLSLLTLLVPTVLMGGTLPILVRSISHSLEDSGKNVAVLYFLNSFGAVLGSTLGGFFLVPMVGLRLSMFGTGLVNITIGIAALLLARIKIQPRKTVQASPSGADRVFSEQEIRIALVVAGVSGIAAMIYEIGWVRLLIPVFGSSTYSFSLMLIAFITGITVGSWIVSGIIMRIKNLFGFLALCQAGVAVFMCATLPLYGRLPWYFARLAHIIQRSESTYPIFLSLEFGLSILIMVVPTIFLGMTLPVASRIATRSIAVMGTSIGNIFSINTLGAVVGTLLGGLILVPAIGIKHTIEIGVGLNTAMAILIFYFNEGAAKAYRLGVSCAILLIGCVYLLAAPNWSQSVMLSGVFRMINTNAPVSSSYASFKGMFTGYTQLYYKEGRSATVAVVRSPGSPERVLVVNGKADASSVGDLPSQTLIGQLPMLLHPNPDTVFVIGLGSGVSLGTVLTHNNVRHVDCAEISPEVVEASRFFDEVNHRPLEDPRARLYIDDALAFLKLTSRTYKVIVSEPTNPWIAGVGNLYTTEFLKLCSQRLSDDGIMVQWFHVYEMDDQTVRLALRTFSTAFPYVTVWQPMSGDIVLIGSKHMIEIEYNELKARMESEAVRKELARINIHSIPTLLSLQILSQSSVDEYIGSGDLNTEDRPLLEYRAPRAFFVNQGTTRFRSYDERMSFRNDGLYINRYKTRNPITDEEWLQIALFQSGPRGNHHLSYSLLAKYCKTHPDSVDALEKLAELTEALGREQEAIAYDRRLAELKHGDALTQEHYAWYALSHEWNVMTPFAGFDGTDAEMFLKRSIELADTVDRCRIRLGEYYYKVRRYPEAEENFRRALTLRQTHPSDPSISQDALLVRLARSVYRQGQLNEAKACAAQALLENPRSEEAKEFLDFLLVKDGGHNLNIGGTQ